MSNTADLLSQARAQRAAGQMHEAEQACREALAENPDSAQACCLLGTICHEMERLEEAVATLQLAISADSNLTEAHHRLGIVLAQLGHLDAAVTHLQRAGELEPGNAEIAHNLQTAVAAREFVRGVSLARQGQRHAAIDCYRRALEVKPDYIEASSALAAALNAQGQINEAIECLSRFAQDNPESAPAHYNLSVAMLGQRRFHDAIASCRRALELDPLYAPAHNNYGVALVEQQDLSQAIAFFRRAVELAPDYAEAHFNLGIALGQQDRVEQATACYARAVELKPDYSDARYRLAGSLREQNKPQEALTHYQQVLAHRPDDADAHVGLAVALFHLGRWAEAWPHYEWRFKCRGDSEPELSYPRWTGSSLAGRTILLSAEQGIGDTLQFIRYAPLVKERGATVIVECDASLVRLAQSCTGIDRVIARGQPRPAADVQACLLSLPGIFGTTPHSVPAEVPYFAPDPQPLERWRTELGAEGALRVGIAWQGNPIHPKDRARSIPLEFFAPLADVPRVRLYSLQFGAGRGQLSRARAWPIIDLGDRLGDFHNTAAIVSNLDLVISCDSAPAHLAGALGTPVWVALPFTPDWRWMLERLDSPWYPTMRLFRQPRRGDWTTAFQRMKEELASLAGG